MVSNWRTLCPMPLHVGICTASTFPDKHVQNSAVNAAHPAQPNGIHIQYKFYTTMLYIHRNVDGNHGCWSLEER